MTTEELYNLRNQWLWIWRKLHTSARMRYGIPGRDIDVGYCLDRYNLIDHYGEF